MVPTDTSSEYLDNERILLPEDAVWFPETQFISVLDIYNLSLLRKGNQWFPDFYFSVTAHEDCYFSSTCLHACESGHLKGKKKSIKLKN